MNLVLDLGNTSAKAALFLGKELTENFVFDKNPVAELKKLVQDHPDIKYSIVSSVISHHKEIINVLQNKTLCVDFDSNTRLPFRVTYQTPETLGKDRLAAAAGAIALYPGKALLVIDAGTCLKYNFINQQGEFMGGAISPGLDMRFKALNLFTDRLPHLTNEPDFQDTIGTSTKGSILSGVQQGTLFEVEGYVKYFNHKTKDGVVLATGGSLPFLADGLKNSIFAAPNLILSGLNEILLHHTSAA